MRLGDTVRKQICELYKTGKYTRNQLGEMFGVPIETVKYSLYKFLYSHGNPNGRPFSKNKPDGIPILCGECKCFQLDGKRMSNGSLSGICSDPANKVKRRTSRIDFCFCGRKVSCAVLASYEK